MRRDPAAIVAAHRMDKARRELYVEGVRDKVFLEWLVGLSKDLDCQIFVIDMVDVPDVSEGGNRARLLAFLREMESTNARLRGFVDSDHDRILGIEESRSNVWITDHRDLESYVISEGNIDATLRAGCGLVFPTACTVYNEAAVHARFIAAIRVYSFRSGLDLPVSAGRWAKHVRCQQDGSVALDRAKVLRSLLQSAGHSLGMMDGLAEGVEAVEEEVSVVQDRDLIQGKDFMTILTKQLAALGVRVDSATHLVFATFDRASVSTFRSLAAVASYVSVEPGRRAA